MFEVDALRSSCVRGTPDDQIVKETAFPAQGPDDAMPAHRRIHENRRQRLSQSECVIGRTLSSDRIPIAFPDMALASQAFGLEPIVQETIPPLQRSITGDACAVAIRGCGRFLGDGLGR